MGSPLAALVLILLLVGLVLALRLGEKPPTVLHDSEGRVIDPAELEGDEPEELKERPKRPPRRFFFRGWPWPR